jgi:hypothetical protein
MIRVVCKVGLDGYISAKWPSQFAVRPEIGDWVQSTNDKHVKLKIMSITHCLSNENRTCNPYLEITLG